jgi:hypothetical protein
MRTKTLLLTAAALAAGLATSMAQGSSNVFSVNIVGYVNTVFKGDGAYTLVANPLDNGTNDLVSLVDAALPNKSSVLVWNGTGYVGTSKSGGAWGQNLAIPVGTGFFVKTPPGSADITNTFVGNIVSATFSTGQTNTVALPANYVLVGSPIPFSGDLTTDANINLGATLPNKSSLLRWDAASQGFVGTSKAGGAWGSGLSVGVGEGFFIKSQTATNWNEVLPAQ